MKTSLVMPVFNGEETLKRALSSVEKQTLAIDEIIIVDDGSTDNTSKIINDHLFCLPITIVKNYKNIGVTKSLALGVSRSTGDLIFRLDADDEWISTHVETIILLTKEYPNAVLYGTRSHIIYKNPKKTKYSDNLNNNNIRKLLLWDNPLVHSSIAFKKQNYLAVGGYGSSKNSAYEYYAQDYLLWLKLLKNGDFAGSENITVNYYALENSVSRIKKNLAIEVRLHAQKIALKAFVLQHPLATFGIWPIVLIRETLNRMNILWTRF